jgi:hypothetical protein
MVRGRGHYDSGSHAVNAAKSRFPENSSGPAAAVDAWETAWLSAAWLARSLLRKRRSDLDRSVSIPKQVFVVPIDPARTKPEDDLGAAG